MTYEQSNQIFKETAENLVKIFASKGAEYSINQVDDRFYHFRLMLNRYLPYEVKHFEIADTIITLRSKQEVCINELIQMMYNQDKLQKSKKTKEYVDEKFNDFLVYTLLLKLLVIESYEIREEDNIEKEI